MTFVTELKKIVTELDLSSSACIIVCVTNASHLVTQSKTEPLKTRKTIQTFFSRMYKPQRARQKVPGSPSMKVLNKS